jgi:alkanesulfonate monooxygenase SsuD/methylene tetrahydromethanopterin reductase-like flavin-dependent oxidoreductase (luciferase family)
MLRLTARYADAWNTAWHGDVTQAESGRANLADALRAEGRDPASMEITVGVRVVFGDLGGDVANHPSADRLLIGSRDDIAARFRAYRDSGVHHLICIVDPDTPEGIAELGEAARLSR